MKTKKIMSVMAVMLMVTTSLVMVEGVEATSTTKWYGVGNNSYGQLGAGDTTNVSTWTQVGSSLGTIKDIQSIYNSSYLITTDGKLYVTGQNNSGRLGTGDTTNVSSWTQVGSTLGTFDRMYIRIGMSQSYGYGFFVTTDEKTYCIGDNSYGQLGLGSSTYNVMSLTEVPMSGIGQIADIQMGNRYTLMLTTDGKLYATGQNSEGQLGTGNTSNISTWTQVGSTLGTFKKIIANQTSSFALTTDGKLYATGENGIGQLGTGNDNNLSSWTQVGSTLGTIEDVWSEGKSTMILTTDGKLYGVGQNNYGQLGTGDTTNLTSWTQVGSSLGTIEKYVLTPEYSLMLTTDGKLYAVGKNNNGQLGTGDTTNLTSWTQVGSSLGTICDVYAGTNEKEASPWYNSFVVADGKLYATGRNSYGQLGTGDTTNVLTWTQVGSSLGTASNIIVSERYAILKAVEISYTVTFNDGNGNTTTQSGSTITLPTPTARPGYTFNGWYSASTGGTLIGTAGASYTPTENKTLYGRWTMDTIAITITGDTSVVVDGTITLTAVLTTTGTLSDKTVTWSIVNGGTNASIQSSTDTANGGTATIKGLSDGGVTIRATSDSVSSVHTDYTITVKSKAQATASSIFGMLPIIASVGLIIGVVGMFVTRR